MLYIGACLPIVPVNAFLESIYEDESGNVYTHQVHNHRIRNFNKVHVKPQSIEATTVQVAIGDDAIYSYVTEDYKLRSGTLSELLPKLIKHLEVSEDIISQIIISSFLSLHGKTAELFDKHDIPYIHLQRDSYFPNHQLLQLQGLKHAIDQSLQLLNNPVLQHLQLSDLIYIDQQAAYIGLYKVSFELAEKLVHEEQSDSYYRIILLDLFCNYKITPAVPVELSSYPFMPGLGDIVTMRMLSKRAGISLVGENRPLTLMSYQTANEVASMAAKADEQMPTCDLDTRLRMKLLSQRAKVNMKQLYDQV